MLPPNPLNQKNIMLEIRAGTGGDEAALFASDLYRMYCRYAETAGVGGANPCPSPRRTGPAVAG